MNKRTKTIKTKIKTKLGKLRPERLESNVGKATVISSKISS